MTARPNFLATTPRVIKSCKVLHQHRFFNTAGDIWDMLGLSINNTFDSSAGLPISGHNSLAWRTCNENHQWSFIQFLPQRLFPFPSTPSPDATNVQAGEKIREMVYQYRDANGG